MEIYRQSVIKNYLGCNRSLKFKDFKTPPSQAMINGKIFEGLLLGFKTDEEKKELTLTKAGKEKAGIEKYNKLADFFRERFIEGNHHERIIIQITDEYKLSFEPDYYGKFLHHSEEIIEAIVDLKLTANISKIWDWKDKKKDFFQACSYTFAIEQRTGKRLPFYYFVVEDNDYEEPIFRVIKVNITDQDIQWFLALAETAHNDIFLRPNADACLGNGRFDPRCRCLEKCGFGREKVGGFNEFNFSDLHCDMDIVIPDNQDWKELGKKKKKVFDEEFLAQNVELKETDIDLLDFKELTYYRSEVKEDEIARCRNCRIQTIQTDTKECSSCGTKINWLED